MLIIFNFQLSIFNSKAQTQTLTYAHYVIDTVTSKEMNGRGYVDSADFKAATFIQHEFQNSNLQSFTADYFQPFKFSANTFPGKMEVKLNGKKLIPGKDYLVDAASSGAKGKFTVKEIPHSASDTSINTVSNIVQWLIEQAGKKILVSASENSFTKKQWSTLTTEIRKYNGFGIKGYITRSSSKLTWDASQEALSSCWIQVKDSIQKKPFKKIKLNIDEQLKENYLSRNVIGFVKGIEHPDSFIVFTAHYDHLGQMGDGIFFPGANDNASGVSMVLNLAKYYSTHPSKYSVVFICFTGEELGLLGSNYFTEHPLFPIDKIKFLINLDIVGTGNDGIKVVNATEFPKQFDQLVKLNDEEQLVKVVSPRGAAANSDHYPFYEKGVPCFFIYTMGGISAYHDIYDRAETLPLSDYEDLLKLLIDFEKKF
ncbi:MAG: M28 family peptidase [Chitinophagales bacterium]|nr:M28 family peptidase [Chitinophagales bacterium]